MSKFCVLGEELEFREEIDHWMELYREQLVLYNEMRVKYVKAYEQAGSMEKVLAEYKDVCMKLLDEVVEKLYKKLVDFEIYDMSKTVYSKNYGLDNIEDLDDTLEIVEDDFEVLYKEKKYQDNLPFGHENKLGLLEMAELNKGIKLYYTEKVQLEELVIGIQASVAELFSLFIKCVNENYGPYYSYYGDVHNSDKAVALFESAKAVSDDDKEAELLLESLMTGPKENPAYEYIIENYGDSDNEVERMAMFFCPEWKEGQKKKDLMDEYLCELDFTSEEALLETLDEIREECLSYGMDAEQYLQPVRKIIDKYNRISKTCDGFVYDDSEAFQMAQKEMERFLEMTQKLDANNEGLLLEIKKEIETNFKMKSKGKYSDFVEDILQDYDVRYRTVKGELYSSREEADRVKEELEKLESIRSAIDFGDAESIRTALEEMSKVQWMAKEKEVYHSLLEECYTLCSEVSEMEAGNVFANRTEQTEIALKIMLVDAKYRSMKISNVKFESLKTAFLEAFCRVMDKQCEDIMSANAEYFKRLSHAQSYAANVVNKGTEKKGLFSKIAGGAKELLSKGYEAEYMYFSDGGEKEVPTDTKEEGKQLETLVKDKLQQIKETEECYATKYAEVGYIWRLEPKEVSGKIVVANKEAVTKDFVCTTMKTVTEFKTPKNIPDITDVQLIRENLSEKYAKFASMSMMHDDGRSYLTQFISTGQTFSFMVGDKVLLLKEKLNGLVFDSELEVVEVKGNSKKADFWEMYLNCDDNQKLEFKKKNKEFVWVVTM